MPPCAWNRRDLLRRGLAVVAGIAAGGPQQVFGGPPEESTRWALLSDTHIDADLDDHYRGFYPYPNLQEVAAVLAYDLPDALIITGDLIRSKGRSPAYENFKTVLTPLARHRPIYLGLGNHDDREDFSQAFAPDGRAGRPVANKRVMVAEAGPVRLIILDSLFFPGALRGRLGEAQRDWLEATLQRGDDKPVILFVHHPLPLP